MSIEITIRAIALGILAMLSPWLSSNVSLADEGTSVVFEIVPAADSGGASIVSLDAGGIVGKIQTVPQGAWSGTLPRQFTGEAVTSIECELSDGTGTKEVELVKLQTSQLCAEIRKSPAAGLSWKVHVPDCIAPSATHQVGVSGSERSDPPAFFADIEEILTEEGRCWKLIVKLEVS